MKKYVWKILIVAVLLGATGAGVQYHRDKQLSKMVGQMILVGFRGTTPDDFEVKTLAADIRRGKVGGVILFSVDVEKGRAAGFVGAELRKQNKSRNIVDVAQVKNLNEFLSGAARTGDQPPLFVSIDQEGGSVARLMPAHGFDFIMPAAKELNKKSMSEIENLYSEMGGRLRDLGFNLNFAPCVDVDVNPKSPAIGTMSRAFSANPKDVAEYGNTAARGLLSAGVISSFKHFPGHGSAGTDTHEGLTDITDSWQEYELMPYVKAPEYSMVMVAHVVNDKIDSGVPASLSKKTINGLLRGQLNYEGIVISDDLQMGAIYENYGLPETLRMAIVAGNDILLLGNNLKYTENLGRVAHSEVVKMVKSGKIPRTRIKESYDRIVKIKEKIK
jgi:beta-N-acetylhexosaminidase